MKVRQKQWPPPPQQQQQKLGTRWSTVGTRPGAFPSHLASVLSVPLWAHHEIPGRRDTCVHGWFQPWWQRERCFHPCAPCGWRPLAEAQRHWLPRSSWMRHPDRQLIPSASAAEAQRIRLVRCDAYCHRRAWVASPERSAHGGGVSCRARREHAGDLWMMVLVQTLTW